MDQLLRDLGHGDLADDFETAYTRASDITSAESGRLDELILNDRAAAEALHSALKALTDLLKVDLTTVLSLEIPKEAAGDND